MWILSVFVRILNVLKIQHILLRDMVIPIIINDMCQHNKLAG